MKHPKLAMQFALRLLIGEPTEIERLSDDDLLVFEPYHARFTGKTGAQVRNRIDRQEDVRRVAASVFMDALDDYISTKIAEAR